MKEHELYLIMSSPADIRNKNIEVIGKVMSEDYHVIVITTNQPYEILKRNYEKKGILLDRIYFIDTVTKNAMGRDPQPAKNCRFINNPADLTGIGIAVTEMLKDLEGKKVCLLFDSISSMLVYMSSQNITKFIHFVTNKLRLLNFAGFFLVVEKGLDPDVLDQLTTFFDVLVDVDKTVYDHKDDTTSA
jgi:KaiC/GvpD/RAD55 family RecA-like ATPase